MPRGRARICSLDVRRWRRAVGRALRSAREARGWSQMRLALTVGVSQATLSRWESGSGAMLVEDLARVAAALVLDVHELIPIVPEAA